MFRSLCSSPQFMSLPNVERQVKASAMLQKAICLLVPMTLIFQLDVGSTVFATEIFLPLAAIFIVIMKGKISLNKYMQSILVLLILYLVAQIFSDLWNDVDYDQYSRGWARIFLFMVNILSIYILIDNKRAHLMLFVVGIALGRIITTLSGIEDGTFPWKIGLSKPVALIVIVSCISLPWLKSRRAYLATFTIMCLGLFDIVMDFRSHGFVLIGVAALLLGSAAVRRGVKRQGVGGLRPIFGISIAGLIAAFSAFQFYILAAESGWLSERATRKFEMQVEEADAPLLVAGRSETLVYFEVIFDSILIGHGSWPRDPYYAGKLVTERYEMGLSHSLSRPANDSIPIHSHFFGSWIEAGLIGASFWGYVLFLIAKSVMKSSIGNSPMRPLYLYGAVLLIWDIFFSPFSGFRRLETAFLIVVVLRSLLQRRGLRRKTKKHARRGSRVGRHGRHRGKRSGVDHGVVTATVYR